MEFRLQGAGTAVLEQKRAIVAREGYRKQATRTVEGVKLVQVGEAGGWWTTEDRLFVIEQVEDHGGGWVLHSAGHHHGFTISLKGQVLQIKRFMKQREDGALHVERDHVDAIKEQEWRDKYMGRSL